MDQPTVKRSVESKEQRVIANDPTPSAQPRPQASSSCSSDVSTIWDSFALVHWSTVDQTVLWSSCCGLPFASLLPERWGGHSETVSWS